MITFPCAKINLGLNIVARRPDGYHDLETVFYPIPLCDVLEVKRMDGAFPSDTSCDLKITGNVVDGNEQDNLVVRAYRLLARDHQLDRVHVHLYKRIPSQAGLGGGSSDAAFMIRLLNERFRLNIGKVEMEHYAAMLGADCSFFITAEPAYATGIGNILSPAEGPAEQLCGHSLVVVKPEISVSTREAYAAIAPQKPVRCCRDIVRQPVETWKDGLTNDFEVPVFAVHPELRTVKEALYRSGAVYAQMSGSGSAFFGIFQGEAPIGLRDIFKNCFVYSFCL